MKPRWYTITELSDATGLPARTIRHLLDHGNIRHWQPGGPNTKRLLDHRTITDLEALGIPVNLGKHGKLGKIRRYPRANRK